jgi:large subunit ribosomal protein L13
MMKSTAMLTREEALAARRWFVIDAQDRVLGRVASEAAKLLRGKGKPSFTPHVDCGDFVVIVNAEQVRLTGPKEETKVYYRHSGFPGGIRSQSAGRMRASHPERLLRLAITGMLPKNRLGRQLATKLKIYAGAEHPHAAQQPAAIELPAAGSKE